MTSINLLPWRVQQRTINTKRFATLLALVVGIAMMLIVFSMGMVLYWTDNQQRRNEMLHNEIELLDDKKGELNALDHEQQMLLCRMTLIKELQASQVMLVHLFDELFTITPLDISLYQLVRHQEHITLKGYATSNSSISRLMRRIDQSAWLQHPVLLGMKQTDQRLHNEFVLDFVLPAQPHMEHQV